MDLAVEAVGDEDVALLRVPGQHEIPNRAVLECLRIEAEFMHERLVLAENLDAVIDAVAHIDAHIDEVVVGDAHAVHRIAEACDSAASGR